MLRDLDALIKQERMEKFKKLDSERYSLTKWLKRQESSLENLIDARYSDRVDLSQVRKTVQVGLCRLCLSRRLHKRWNKVKQP